MGVSGGMEEPGVLQSMKSRRDGHDVATEQVRRGERTQVSSQIGPRTPQGCQSLS